jgi:hypothetical protein
LRPAQAGRSSFLLSGSACKLARMIEAPDHDILLPQHSSNELAAEQERDAALGVGLGHLMATALHDIDHRLQLRFAKPGARLLDEGYWYFIRFNDAGVAPSYWKLTEKGGLDDEHGPGYSHPEWAHIESLQKRDTWRHPHVWREYEKRRANARRDREKHSEELHREFREKLLDRLNHIYGVQIAVTGAMKARADGEGVSEGGAVLPALVADRLTGRAAISEIETRYGIGDQGATPPSPVTGGEETSHPPTPYPNISERNDDVN